MARKTRRKNRQRKSRRDRRTRKGGLPEYIGKKLDKRYEPTLISAHTVMKRLQAQNPQTYMNKEEYKKLRKKSTDIMKKQIKYGTPEGKQAKALIKAKQERKQFKDAHDEAVARKAAAAKRSTLERQKGYSNIPSLSEPEAEPQFGGKRRKRRKTNKKRKTEKIRKMRKRKRTRKRKLNPYFKLMLDAKKKGLESFKYKGKTYKGRKHERLGMIYKKA